MFATVKYKMSVYNLHALWSHVVHALTV